jgi:hypothetical protein
MDQRQIQNGMSEFEAHDADGSDVTALLNALPRVQAPDNFEFGVKAKIARHGQTSSALTPFLKLAAPFGLVLVMGVIVLFYGLRPSDADVAVIADPARTESNFVPPTAEIPASPAPAVSIPQAEQRTETRSVPERAAASETRGPVRKSTSSATPSTEGGSFDIALGSAKAKLPPGFDAANPRTSPMSSNSAQSGSPVREALEILGVTSSFANGGWQVGSVTANSIASRGKVLAGDVILAIDGQQLKSDSTIRGNITTLSVRRDGKTLSLKLGN